MNEFIDFLAEMNEKSLNLIEQDQWTVLRPLAAEEVEHLWQIDEAKAEMDLVIAELRFALTDKRRTAVRNRGDLTDDELELLERFSFARDVLNATQNAFWSPLRYEFREYERLKLDIANSQLLGRGNNRRSGPMVEVMGTPTDDEIDSLKRLFGESSVS